MKNLIICFSIILLCNKAFAQTPNYEVYAIKYADAFNGEPFPLKYLVMDAPENETGIAIFMFWLIKDNNSKNILVDAGFLDGIEDAKNYGVANYIRPDIMLDELNLKASDITDIILTHPHWDHMDGVDLFPNAQVWIQKEDFNYCVGESWQKDGVAIADKRDVVKLIELNLAGKLTLVNGDNVEIIPGITVHTGSRHTFNSQYIEVQTNDKTIIIASDNAYTYYNIEHEISAIKEATFDTDGYVKAIKRMKTLASDEKYIIPGHDALLFSKFPEISKGILKIN